MRNTPLSVLAWLALTAGVRHMTLAQTTAPADNGWLALHKGMATIEAETTLYEKKDDAHFFIHFRVRNNSDHPIAVDLRDYWRVIYPNQWGALDEAQRVVIDERRIIHQPLEARQTAEVLDAFRNGKLTSIPPGQSIDYFRECNASGRREVEKQSAGHRFVFVSLDGEQLVTDGKNVEQVTDKSEGALMELMLPVPTKWKSIPANGRIVSEHTSPTTQPAER